MAISVTTMIYTTFLLILVYSGVHATFVQLRETVMWSGAMSLCQSKGGNLPALSLLQAKGQRDNVENYKLAKIWINFEFEREPEYDYCPKVEWSKKKWELQLRSCSKKYNVICYIPDEEPETTIIPTEHVTMLETTEPETTQPVTTEQQTTPHVTTSIKIKTTTVVHTEPTTDNTHSTENISDQPSTPNCHNNEQVSGTGNEDSAGALVYVIIVLLVIVFIVIPVSYVIYRKRNRVRFDDGQELGFIDDKSIIEADGNSIYKNSDMSKDRDNLVFDIPLSMKEFKDILKAVSQTGELTMPISKDKVNNMLSSLPGNSSTPLQSNVLKLNDLVDIRELLRLCYFEKGDANAAGSEKNVSTKNDSKAAKSKPDVVS